MKNNMAVLISLLLGFVFISPYVFATNSIDATKITLSDTHPTTGDIVRVEFEFDVRAYDDPKVILYLYVDGKLYEKRTEYLFSGKHKRTFRIDTYDLEAGTYNVEVEAKIYDERGHVDDTDTKNKYLYVKGEIKDSRVCYHYYDDYYGDYYYDGYCYTYPTTRYHTKDPHLTITQISYDRSVLKSARIPVKVYVKNEGDYTEYVKLTIEMGESTITTDSEYIAPGDERARIVYITAPYATGTYTVRIKATSRYDQHIVEDFIDVTGTTISMYANPKERSKTGEWIHVYGYAMDGERGSVEPVKIYKDSIYIEQAIPESTGYYSSYVRFYEPGEHAIRVYAGSVEKTKMMYIEGEVRQEQAETTTSPPEEEQEQIDDTDSEHKAAPQTINQYNITNYNITNKYYTVIVVADENKTVDVDGTDITITVEKEENSVENGKDNDIPEIPGFVGVDVNSKTLNIEQYSGGALKVIITNNLGEPKVFSIETDFDESIVLVSEPDVVAPGETKIFPVYFTTYGKDGKHEGNVSVLQDGEAIKTIPVTVYTIAQTPETPETKKDMTGILGVDAIVAVFVLFLIALGYFLVSRKKTTGLESPLEPRSISPYLGRYIPKMRTEQKHPKAKHLQERFEVPWENVIY